MKSRALQVAMAASMVVGLAGCDKIKSVVHAKPSGQVVATVEGEEITALELRSELGGFSSRDPKVMKAAQDQALQTIVVRDLVAHRARTQKLDKSPQFTLQVRRGERTLLAQLYESKLFQSVTPPTRQEAQTFVGEHPEKFADRRLFVLEKVVSPAANVDAKQIAPLKTLDEIKTFLDQHGVPYEEEAAAVDTLIADIKVVRAMEKLAPGEVFFYPRGGTYEFNRVSQVRNVPLRGEPAIQFATTTLRRVQAEDFVRSQLIALRRTAEPSITYAKGYKPDNPDAGIAAIGGAPAAPEKTDKK